jgi:hypothetical protein
MAEQRWTIAYCPECREVGDDAHGCGCSVIPADWQPLEVVAADRLDAARQRADREHVEAVAIVGRMLETTERQRDELIVLLIAARDSLAYRGDDDAEELIERIDVVLGGMRTKAPDG